MPSSFATRMHAGADRLLDLAVIIVLVGGVLVPFAMADAAETPPVVLNEALVLHRGANNTEFVELNGVPGTSLEGLSLLSVDGDNSLAGIIDLRLDFPAGATVGGNGFFLVGNPVGLNENYGVTPDLTIGTNVLPNGSQTLALVETATVGAKGTSVTGDESVWDAVGLRDAFGADTWFFGAPVLGPWDGFAPPGVRRVTDGVDTDTPDDWVLADFELPGANTPTPATPFSAPPVADCGPALVTSQGTAASAPVAATDPDGRVTAFTLAVVPDPGTVTLGSTTPATAAGESATTSIEVGAGTPAGSYAATATAWTDDAAPQSATCELAVTVEAAPEPSMAAVSALLDELVASGAVAESKGHLLAERLDRADRFLADGQLAAAQAQLLAFANQVAGMSPRWVSADAAEVLASACQELAEALASS